MRGAVARPLPFFLTHQKKITMRKTITLLAGLTGLLIVTVSGTSDIDSNGAPIGTTGAPGEQTCGRVGCHVGDNGADNINTGSGLLTIELTGMTGGYVPGGLHEVTVRMAEPGIMRFGFMLTALGADGSSMGELRVIEPTLTQVKQGVLDFANREYVTYRNAGTYPPSPGEASWTFQWLAPEHSSGNVTMYAAAVSADNDGTDLGDLVYSTSITLSPEGQTSIQDISKGNLALWPNPVVDMYTVELPQPMTGAIMIKLYSLDGSRSHVVFDGVTPSDGIVRLVRGNISSGAYLLLVTGNGIDRASRIIFQ